MPSTFAGASNSDKMKRQWVAYYSSCALFAVRLGPLCQYGSRALGCIKKFGDLRQIFV